MPIEAVEVHHLVPSSDEIADKFLLAVLASVDFGQCAQDRIRSKDEIDARGGPLRLAALAIVTFPFIALGTLLLRGLSLWIPLLPGLYMVRRDVANRSPARAA